MRPATPTNGINAFVARRTMYLGAVGLVACSSNGDSAQELPFEIALQPAIRIAADSISEIGPGAEPLGSPAAVFESEDGRLVIADRNARIFIIDNLDVRSSVNLGSVRSFGNRGSGPNEFRSIDWASRWRRDSIVVYDHAARRFSFFSLQSGRGRIANVPDGRSIIPLGVLDDELAIATAQGFSAARPGPSGIVTDSSPVYFADSTALVVDSVGLFPIFSSYVERATRSVAVTERAFSTGPLFAFSDTTFVTADAERGTVRWYSRRGQLVSQIVLRRRTLAVSSADIDAYVAKRLAPNGASSSNARIERLIRAQSFPDDYPMYDRLLIGADGLLWARRQPGVREQNATWLIVDRNGIELGCTTLPAALRVTSIGARSIVGVHTISDGSEVIELRRFAPARTRAKPCAL